MKYSYNWLRELSGTEKSAQEIAELLIAHAFEVEDVIDLEQGLEDVIIGHLTEVAAHPDADKLRIATVDVGSEESLQIVCGAPNLAVGQKVPVAMVGAVLPGDFKIKKSKIRGVESHGMICGEDEIITDAPKSDGILILSDEAPIGGKFSEWYGRDDIILDIDILPNRGHDALSHFGMAHEIAALEGRNLERSPQPKKELSAGIPVTVETGLCSRYSALTLSGVTVGPSPQWIQNRLRSLGIKVINNIVDVTNYVMLETGQPLHAFDAHSFEKVGVRMARDDEKLMFLDEVERDLDTSDIVITGDDEPVALAGVMGGQASGIADDTTDVILEAAHFDPVHVRRSRSRHNLVTDAAYRFERNPHESLIDQGLQSAARMISDIAGGKVVAVTDIADYDDEVPDIVISQHDIKRLLGAEIPVSEVEAILISLGCEVRQEDKLMICTPPRVRRDLQEVSDLIEEIGRVWGYHKIIPVPLPSTVESSAINETRQLERSVKDRWVTLGYSEIRSYSFYAQDVAVAAGQDQPHISLLNPMSTEQELMRGTLAVGVLKSAALNQSYAERSHVFEIGRLYATDEQGLPQETRSLAAAATGKDKSGAQFYELKGACESFLTSYGLAVDFIPVAELGLTQMMHPSRTASIMIGDVNIGYITEVSRATSKVFGIKKNRTAYMEIDLTTLAAEIDHELSFEKLSEYPFVDRDISLIVPARMHVSEVERAIYNAKTTLLCDVDLFDLYVDKETGERSMAFRLRFGSHERTLTTEEVDRDIEVILDALNSAYEVQLKS